MKNVVILAAGIGSRLRPFTDTTPKSLVQVSGVPLLERLVKQIISHGDDHKITVVAGYLCEQIIASMNNFEKTVNVIVNKEYDNTNNMESCRLALEATKYTDCVIVNADCIYDDYIVNSMLDSEISCIAIDSSEYFEENMKVKLGGANVNEISKALLDVENVFTSIDIYSFIKSDVDELLNVMNGYFNSGDLKKWNEVAINDIVKFTEIGVVDFKGYKWVEIDNNDDLKKAEGMFN